MKLTAEFYQKPNIATGEKLRVAWSLSYPAILAQLTSILMQYIDSAMVGQMGAAASASIGLVASTIWLFNGVGSGAVYGYSVQISHAVGAGDRDRSRSLYRQGLLAVCAFGCLLAGVGLAVSGALPGWLGGASEVREDATRYFRVCMLALPVSLLQRYITAALQAAGNMKITSIFSSVMCVLDVVFNLFFIFPTGEFTLGPISFYLRGMGWGVAGAAWGTAFSYIVVLVILACIAGFRQDELKFTRGSGLCPRLTDLRSALRIGTPIALEQAASCGAQIVATRLVSPLGTVSLAAHSFVITAESLCYMPGVGIASAATILVGQSIGAQRKDLARSFAWITTLMGVAIMTVAGAAMYFFCPALFRVLTPVTEVQELAVQALRVELLSEPIYAAAIVIPGALRGAGDTLVPSLMNLGSMWCVRLVLMALLVGPCGLVGVWTAICIELCFRGAIFLLRLKFGHWDRSVRERG